jgi:hypothetical protein
VRQLAFEPVRNLDVTMSVHAKSLPRLHAILVDDPQRPESHLRRIVVVGERKGMTAIDQRDVRPHSSDGRRTIIGFLPVAG